MINDQNKGGRPFLTDEQKEKRKTELLQIIKPYLQSGLSVNKALNEAKILNSEFYKYMSEDELFREKVIRMKNYVPVLLNNVIVKELYIIAEKQNGNPAKGIPPQPLSKDDKSYLMWFALNSNLTKEEYGRREHISTYDPEEEIQRIKKMIDENTTEEILHIN